MLPSPPRILAALLGLLPLAALAADPTPVAGPTPVSVAESIRTPPAPATPRINGPRVYGARPGHPFFYHLPVTGERPMTFAATGLPAGLTLDPQTGNVTGTATERGAHPVEFTATNARGSDKATLSVVIGDTICLTPPLGWNSWNHFGEKVTGDDVRASADAMVSSGLIDHGWTYVNIDDCWQAGRDAEGNIQGNQKFPDLKAIGDYVHSKGLKFGIYSSPGTRTCANFPASYQHEDQDARSYADWGVDYVKYDLCSYSEIIRERLCHRLVELLPPDQQSAYLAMCEERTALQINYHRTPEQSARLKELDVEANKATASLDPAKLKAINLDEQQIPYRVFGQSLAKVPRDIVYSFCQYGNADSWEWAASLGGNSWRTGGDIRANWKSITDIGFRQDRLAKYAGPGHWNDPDMLEVGNRASSHRGDRDLTPDENYTHMTLWCMLASPLLIGCDMSQMDPLTVSMFSNDEVLAVNQDALGQQGHRLKAEGTSEVWVKPLANGGLAVALFNRGEQPAEVGTSWDDLFRGTDLTDMADKLLGVRDLWRQRDLPYHKQGITLQVAPHSAELLQVGLLTVNIHGVPQE